MAHSMSWARRSAPRPSPHLRGGRAGRGDAPEGLPGGGERLAGRVWRAAASRASTSLVDAADHSRRRASGVRVAAVRGRTATCSSRPGPDRVERRGVPSRVHRGPGSPGCSAGRPGGGRGLVAFEAQEKLAEQVGERALLVGGEAGQQAPFVVQVQRGDRVGELHAAWGERDVEAACVLGVDQALDESGVLQPVQGVGDRAGGAHQGLVQLGGGEPVGLADAAQGGQHVPRRSGEAVLGEHGVQGRIDVGLGAAEPGDDPDRAGVEIGPLAGPLPAHLRRRDRSPDAAVRRLFFLHAKILSSRRLSPSLRPGRAVIGHPPHSGR